MAIAELPSTLLEITKADNQAPRTKLSPPKVRLRWVLAWFAVTCLGRGLLTLRVEGLLDHDQAVVGLMALDISEGRRWPIFFDGQRYMGAIEAYVAAVFVRAFGLSPVVVSIAPLLFCGAFVAGQYAVWTSWRGQKTGHLAAL